MINDTMLANLLEHMSNKQNTVTLCVYIPMLAKDSVATSYRAELTIADTTASSYEKKYDLNKDTYTFTSSEPVFAKIVSLFKEQLNDPTTKYVVEKKDNTDYYRYAFTNRDYTDDFSELVEVLQEEHQFNQQRDEYRNAVARMYQTFNHAYAVEKKQYKHDVSSNHLYMYKSLLSDLVSKRMEVRVTVRIPKPDITPGIIVPDKKHYVSIEVADKEDPDPVVEDRYAAVNFSDDNDIFYDLITAVQPALEDENVVSYIDSTYHYNYQFYDDDVPQVMRNIYRIVQQYHNELEKILNNPAQKAAQKMFNTLGVEV